MLCVAVLLAACARGGPPPISTGERYVASVAFDEQYELGAGDKIRLVVFNEPQLSGEFSVGANGEISLPLIGNVQVAGRTANEVSEIVAARFSDGYLRDPRVSTEVVVYRPIFVLGEVRKAGQYPYQSGLTAMNAIATAEGFTPRAAKGTVLIRRYGEAYEQEYVLTPDLRVWPGDTVRVAERFF